LRNTNSLDYLGEDTLRVKPHRSRSASMSDTVPSVDIKRFAGDQKVKTISIAENVSNSELLCVLPEKFSFGQYTVETKSISYRAGRAGQSTV
jgi:hypothetical protein